MQNSYSLAGCALLFLGAAWSTLESAPAAQAASAFPNFAPDPNVGWVPARPEGDEFLPPPSGPGPVQAERGHAYIPNRGGQPTYRIADLSNPILKPWVVDRLKEANDLVRAGKVPFVPHERCWPGGVPGWEVYTRVRPIYFLQTAKKVTMIDELDHQVRHVYMNVAHSRNVKPSWYGESVGHYEGDELVIDTIGLDDKSLVDNYGTPHTGQIHVVERFKLVDGGKTLQATVTVDDPGAFNMAWSAVQRWRRGEVRPLEELACAENNYTFLNYDVVPIPEAAKPDF
jgi:hypothetical protein